MIPVKKLRNRNVYSEQNSESFHSSNSTFNLTSTTTTTTLSTKKLKRNSSARNLRSLSSSSSTTTLTPAPLSPSSSISLASSSSSFQNLLKTSSSFLRSSSFYSSLTTFFNVSYLWLISWKSTLSNPFRSISFFISSSSSLLRFSRFQSSPPWLVLKLSNFVQWCFHTEHRRFFIGVLFFCGVFAYLLSIPTLPSPPPIPSSFSSFVSNSPSLLSSPSQHPSSDTGSKTLSTDSTSTTQTATSFSELETLIANLTSRLRLLESQLSNPSSPFLSSTSSSSSSSLSSSSASCGYDDWTYPDHANVLLGAKVISKFTSPTFTWSSSHFLFKYFGKLQGHPPETAFHPGEEVGQCWAMAGSKGHVFIQLAQPIVPTFLVLRHSLVTPDLRSAPHSVRVFAVYWNESFRSVSSSSSSSTTPTKSFSASSHTMDLNHAKLPSPWDLPIAFTSSDVSTYESTSTSFLLHLGDLNFTQPTLGSIVLTLPSTLWYHAFLQQHPVHYVFFNILNNHGHPERTCIYRFQVHGKAILEEKTNKNS